MDPFELIPDEEGGEKEVTNTGNIPEALHTVTALSGMYQDWFLDYASYVILERAVPHISDGLKPVQRRILYSMKRMDDGRFNKVANIIGHTMQFHPHGDASIGDALVQLGQKELLVESQGNWGNILTGDGAAAPRYIEARLSKFALEVTFNSKTTEWMSSYDGRNREPVTLPVKYPLLLAMGVEGIAVGLSSKILPHNFNELIDASISYLQGKPFEIYPDFPTGGMIDVSKYNDGARGGVVKVRARIEKSDRRGLVITEIPFGRTTSSLIESIVKANDRGKIKIRKIDDNTAGGVEIVIQLQSGVSPDKTIDALYAFTDCELSISPNACVITDENKPAFIGVSDILRHSADQTVKLLTRELEIRKAELDEEWHFSSLEKIFIEKRIYRDIEECETWEAVLSAIDKGLKPYRKLFRREITREDIIKLTEIKIKRISKYDSSRADEHIRGIENELEEVANHLANIVPFAINYYRQIKKKYGKDKERRTEIRSFETIEATKVVAANAKLYVNRQEGFIGTSLKKDEYVCDCSDIDDIIVIRKDGSYLITRVAEKQFVGKDVIHVQVFLRNDTRTIYNIAYQDGRTGPYYVKRCALTGLTRDKDYNLGKGTPGTRILYLSANPNGEAEVIRVYHKPKARLKKLTFDFDFGELAIKGRGSMGNILTKNPVHKITLKEKGLSTLGGRKLWYDEAVMRLNADGRGRFLGEFASDELLLVITKGGWFRTSGTDLSSHFEDDLLLLEKYRETKIFSAVYWDQEQEYYYVKRFAFEESDRLQCFIADSEGSRLVSLTEVEYPRLEIKFGGKNEGRKQEIIEVAEFIGVKSFRAKGRRLSNYSVADIRELEPVIRSEAAPGREEEANDDEERGSVHGAGEADPAQMKLDL
ncbi:MAG: DNA gyrase/topoisomerase IV subunit A [Bacteroidales bacterium]|nr:DNA gyrase/topoisomerase IV subunit A [Bacteroidales bacterium]MCB9027899.1 DNA gyrase/topoisomerase IV subunit A [Bacteroidales bacterium]HOO66694.1 DNA gyrase/topoisomerase IV subunit A [Bacteroidales bacterium]HPE22800.1 DNA gyrase/topoisomerase IV subunit A [Bacteroidales bacterium]HPJ04360.1 DNA gyrase/topoisomerase IV subunit A [Bacteroidales bacterium]